MAKHKRVDPATTDRIYDEDEFEFIQCVMDYQSNSGRVYPTLSEYLGLVKQLGYRKPAMSPDPIRDVEDIPRIVRGPIGRLTKSEIF